MSKVKLTKAQEKRFNMTFGYYSDGKWLMGDSDRKFKLFLADELAREREDIIRMAKSIKINKEESVLAREIIIGFNCGMDAVINYLEDKP